MVVFVGFCGSKAGKIIGEIQNERSASREMTRVFD
jgi:hypothetical protein